MAFILVWVADDKMRACLLGHGQPSEHGHVKKCQNFRLGRNDRNLGFEPHDQKRGDAIAVGAHGGQEVPPGNIFQDVDDTGDLT